MSLTSTRESHYLGPAELQREIDNAEELAENHFSYWLELAQNPLNRSSFFRWSSFPDLVEIRTWEDWQTSMEPAIFALLSQEERREINIAIRSTISGLWNKVRARFPDPLEKYAVEPIAPRHIPPLSSWSKIKGLPSLEQGATDISARQTLVLQGSVLLVALSNSIAAIHLRREAVKLIPAPNLPEFPEELVKLLGDLRWRNH